jgi:hypothetical protein
MSTVTLALLLALVAQVAIAMVLLWVMGSIRLPMIARKDILIEDIALSRQPWPEHEKRVSHAFDNQFQLPVLFYVAGLVALYLNPNWIEAFLAWGFVISRIAHAAIFATTNHVVRRFWAFTIGYFILCVFWLELVARLFILALGNT